MHKTRNTRWLDRVRGRAARTDGPVPLEPVWTDAQLAELRERNERRVQAAIAALGEKYLLAKPLGRSA